MSALGLCGTLTLINGDTEETLEVCVDRLTRTNILSPPIPGLITIPNHIHPNEPFVVLYSSEGLLVNIVQFPGDHDYGITSGGEIYEFIVASDSDDDADEDTTDLDSTTAPHENTTDLPSTISGAAASAFPTADAF